MSARRNIGDVVWLAPHSGFVGESNLYQVRLLGEPLDQSGLPYSVCMLCNDPECREWYNVQLTEGPYKGSQLPHVSECQMFDEPRK